MDSIKLTSKILSVITAFAMLVAFLITINLADTTQDILKGIAIMLFYGILHITITLKTNK